MFSIALLLACSDASDDTRDEPPATATVEQQTTPPAELPPPVQSALAAAARDAGIETDQVELLGFNEVEWPTSALGCEQPGQLYAQVMTPGYRVRLRVASMDVAYHTDHGTRVVRCE